MDAAALDKVALWFATALDRSSSSSSVQSKRQTHSHTLCLSSEPPRDLSLIRHIAVNARTIAPEHVASGACLNGPRWGDGVELRPASRRAFNNETFAVALSLPKQIFSHGIMDEEGRIEERTK